MSNETETNQAERLERPRVEALDRILGEPLKVLDDGFVRVVDYMGADESIVQAARVSYGKGTKKVLEDRGLIRYLLRHRHTTPFEMCEIKLHVRVPMDCWRQWIRHRSASVNEYSTRYSIAIDAAQATPPGQWRKQSTGNRQGSAGYFDAEAGQALSNEEAELHKESRRIYEARIEKGVAREQARKDLPLSTYTEAYWKIDLHNLLHFLALRMEDHSQLEIRNYAKRIGEDIVAKWVPFTWEAFIDYRMNSVALSAIEREVARALAKGDSALARKIVEDRGWLEPAAGGGWKRNREREELESKLADLNLAVPWQ
jgi:thymidylate synthase (FAD)